MAIGGNRDRRTVPNDIFTVRDMVEVQREIGGTTPRLERMITSYTIYTSADPSFLGSLGGGENVTC
jgi:hypothetical protein